MNRDHTIDYLRAIGLYAIILAHIASPWALHQLRNFDVPLMVFISGISFSLSKTSSGPYLKYAWSRIKRLLFPVWIFLTLFFALSSLTHVFGDYSFEVILESFTLSEGIGYVWIIQIFIIVSLLAPFLSFIVDRTLPIRWLPIALLGSMLIFSMIFLNLGPETRSFFSLNYFARAFINALFYSHIFIFGMIVKRLSFTYLESSFLVLLTGFTLICYYLYMSTGGYVSTQFYKYPPTFYYFSYAIGVSLVLYVLIKYSPYNLNGPIRSVVLFTARNSIWIYLWHIAFLKVLQTYSLYWVFKYPLVLCASVVIVFCQYYFLETYVFPMIKSKKTLRNIKLCLTG